LIDVSSIHPNLLGSPKWTTALIAQGLGLVRSSKAYRLTRIKPGFFSPPTRPIFVPGLQWIGVLALGMSGPPTVAAMR